MSDHGLQAVLASTYNEGAARGPMAKEMPTITTATGGNHALTGQRCSFPPIESSPDIVHTGGRRFTPWTAR